MVSRTSILWEKSSTAFFSSSVRSFSSISTGSKMCIRDRENTDIYGGKLNKEGYKSVASTPIRSEERRVGERV